MPDEEPVGGAPLCRAVGLFETALSLVGAIFAGGASASLTSVLPQPDSDTKTAANGTHLVFLERVPFMPSPGTQDEKIRTATGHDVDSRHGIP
jgi:hypothetical protein